MAPGHPLAEEPLHDANDESLYDAWRLSGLPWKLDADGAAAGHACHACHACHADAEHDGGNGDAETGRMSVDGLGSPTLSG